MRLRDAAGPQPFEPGLALELVQPAVKTPVKLVGANHHLQLAAQAFGRRLGHIHVQSPFLPARRGNGFRASLNAWCGRRDSNPHGRSHQNLNLACLPVPPRPRERLSVRVPVYNTADSPAATPEEPSRRTLVAALFVSQL